MADRWVTQTKFYDPSQPPEVCTGNCTEAAFASLLGLRLDEVPSFQGLASSAYWNAVHEFAESKGFALVMNQRKEHYPGLYLADGPSVRGCGHFVVMHDGHMVHDPHPSRSGITEIERTWVLVPMDPAATQPPAVGVDVSDAVPSLPALPKPWGTDYDDIDNEDVETFTASQMKAYARAALTAALRTGGGA